ncbi:MAG: glycosyltransferase family 2 protein [Candidatus Aminicenantes bacterium]|nr:glycosyltransferase family 2 protein [Candidatus Aminicenantes bacterium]
MTHLSLTLEKSVPRRNLGLVFPSIEKKDFLLALMIAVFSIGVLALSLKFQVFDIWKDFLTSTKFLKFSTYFLIPSSIVMTVGLLFRTILWIRYKPVIPRENTIWPSISVIMPALNEEDSILESIESIFASHYPKDRLEVIAINDGSTDSTLQKMMDAKKRHKDHCQVIHFPKNMGKRTAIYRGVKIAKGEMIVTVDTDSRIDPNALRNIVVPLLQDKKCGAVAGRVEVWNRKDTLLTRMLSVRYSLSFNFGRAYQSVFGTVLCCPGALTAYRKDIVLKFLDDWKNQKFLNSECTYGEDRALTTLILKSGFMTRFQSNAVVFTRVPARFKKMVKMYIRWNRSCFRETVLFSRFMFSKYRNRNRALPLIDFFFLNIIYPFHLFAFGIIIYSFAAQPVLFLRHLSFIILGSFFLSLYYLRSQKNIVFLYGIPYGLLTALCLWWIFPFAVFSVRSKSWMTR